MNKINNTMYSGRFCPFLQTCISESGGCSTGMCRSIGCEKGGNTTALKMIVSPEISEGKWVFVHRLITA